MKIVLLFLSLALLNTINCFQEAKNFLTEFIKTTTDDKIHFDIPELCLGKFFNYHFLLLKKNFKENNFEKLSTNIENIVIDTFINCPNLDFMKIFNMTEFEDFSLIPKTKVYMKLISLGTILYFNYNNNTLTGASLGKSFGEFINLFRNNYTNPKEIEGGQTNTSKNISILDNLNEYFDAIGSIFIGMKEKDDGNESLCYQDIIKGKSKIIDNIQKSFEKADKNKGISSIASKILFSLITVEGLVVDCNLIKLGTTIFSKLTSLKEVTGLLTKMMENSDIYIEYFGKIIECFKNNNMKEAGIYLGKIISNIFDFHVK